MIRLHSSFLWISILLAMGGSFTLPASAQVAVSGSDTAPKLVCCKCTFKSGGNVCINDIVNDLPGDPTFCKDFIDKSEHFQPLKSESSFDWGRITCSESLDDQHCQVIGKNASASCPNDPISMTTVNGALDDLQKYADKYAALDKLQATPTLGVPVPGLEFSAPYRSGSDVVIPFLGQYIAAMYRYAVGISVIVAIVMVVYGAFRYLIGSIPGDVKRGKTIMIDAIAGMLITLAAFLILETANPATLKLDALRVPFVNPEDLAYADKKIPTKVGPFINNTTYDTLFQNYASCYDYDWRLLKAVGGIESGLDPRNQTGKYQGLFQFDTDGCIDNTKSYPSSLRLDCNNLFDPETGTAAMAWRLSKQLAKIQASCGSNNLTMEEYVLLLYTAHNNGPGVLSYVLRNHGCHKSEQLQWVRNYSAAYPKYGAYVSSDYGQQKWEYGENAFAALSKMGATDLFPAGNHNPGRCPRSTGQRTNLGQ